MALIMISHDLGVIAETTDRVVVMYGGAVVEQGTTESLFANLAHPYTKGLFAAVPRLGLAERTRLNTIPGTVPDLIDLPPGCPFVDRCPWAIDACRPTPPPPVDVAPGHVAACIRLDDIAEAERAAMGKAAP
jgi:peptide/nickel transport system ATP-binding protein